EQRCVAAVPAEAVALVAVHRAAELELEVVRQVPLRSGAELHPVGVSGETPVAAAAVVAGDELAHVHAGAVRRGIEVAPLIEVLRLDGELRRRIAGEERNLADGNAVLDVARLFPMSVCRGRPRPHAGGERPQRILYGDLRDVG